MASKAWTLGICTATNVYLLGAMVLFATVTYPQFASVDRAAFPALYQSFNARIGLPVVSMEFLAALATVPLYFWRSDSVPLWAVHALVALALGYFAITFAWHLPAHRPLAAGDNAGSALAPLLASQWARTALQGVRAGLLVWLSAKAVGA
jgi:hypothetical protein